MSPIFTIGHSNRTWEELVDALKKYQLGFVVDVRTTPGSRRNPHFSQGMLSHGLPEIDIQYLFLGSELGARRTEPHLLSDIGLVSYRKVRKTPEYQTAIARIEKGAADGHRLALLCSEGEPIDCHRFPMIAYQLAQDGFDVQHICRDDSLITQADLEAELLRQYAKEIPETGLFTPEVTESERLEAAYDRLNIDLARKQARATGDSK